MWREYEIRRALTIALNGTGVDGIARFSGFLTLRFEVSIMAFHGRW